MKIRFKTVSALVRKRAIEFFSSFRRFDAGSFFLRLFALVALGGAFILLFCRFLGVYLSLETGGTGMEERLYEVLTFAYALLLAFLTVSGTLAVSREMVGGEQVLSALPVSAGERFVSQLFVIYARQLFYAAAVLLAVHAALLFYAPPSLLFGAGLALLLLPLLSVALASLLALPYCLLLRFLRPRFVLSLVLVTALTAAGLYLYSLLLGAAKELLLFSRVAYFFGEGEMAAIARTAAALFPANRLAAFVVGRSRAANGVLLLALSAGCLLLSVLLLRPLLLRTVLRERPRSYRGGLSPRRPVLFALLKREFLEILRTPSYAFSYFSVALVMPLMVYLCMSVGASLVKRALGTDCTVELALLLTLLYGSLTNVFCAGNVSREGTMLRLLKTYPLRAGEIVGAKVLLCMLVAVLSQLVSALLLVGWTGRSSLFLFAAGTLFSFAQICFATRYDLAHASPLEEETGAVGVCVALGVGVSLLLGGGSLLLRLAGALRMREYAAFPVPAVLLALSALALLSGAYLFVRLREKYRAFAGGGVL